MKKERSSQIIAATGAGGFALGIFICWLWMNGTEKPPGIAVESDQERIVQPQKLQPSSWMEEPQKAAENREPQEGSIDKYFANRQSTKPDPNARKNMLLRQLNIFAYRVGLTPEQLAYYRERIEGLSMLGGQRPLKWGDIEHEILPRLNEIQKTSLEAFNEERRLAGVEVSVHTELYRLQMSLGLSEEQKERAFQALVDVNLKTSEAEPGNVDPMDLKRDALSKILSPEQIAAYDDRARARQSTGPLVFNPGTSGMGGW